MDYYVNLEQNSIITKEFLDKVIDLNDVKRYINIEGLVKQNAFDKGMTLNEVLNYMHSRLFDFKSHSFKNEKYVSMVFISRITG